MQTYFCSRLTSRNTKIRAEIMRIPSNYTHDNSYDHRVIGHWKQSLQGSDSPEIRNRCVVIDLSGFYAEIFMGSCRDNFQMVEDATPLRFIIPYCSNEFSKRKSRSEKTMNTVFWDLDQDSLVRTLIVVLRIEAKGLHTLTDRSPVIKTLEPPLNRGLQRAKKQPRTRKLEREEYRKRWLATAEPVARIELAKQYGISDLEGLKIVGDTWANPVPLAAIFERLEFLVKTELPCTVAFANNTQWQAHTGKLVQMELKNTHFSLAGIDWNSSIPLSEIESAWLVNNPASGRMEYSIELFNRVGLMMIRISGTPDVLENAVWQDLLGTLPTLS